MLLKAACEGKPEKVKELLKDGAIPNAKDKDGKTPLVLAGHAECAAVLQEAINQQGEFLKAVKNCDLITVNTMLKGDYSEWLANAEDSEGDPVLHLAFKKMCTDKRFYECYEKIFKALLKAGADEKAKDKDGKTVRELYDELS